MDDRLKEIAYSLHKFEQAIQRLGDALASEDSDLKVDGTIQRFEFTFELAWKTIRRALLYEGEICKTPRECLKAAFRLALLDEEEPWLSMLDDRNRMAHIYDEAVAREIFERVPAYHQALRRLAEELRRRYAAS